MRDSTHTLLFRNKKIDQYVRDSGPRFRYVTNFEYHQDLLTKINELNSKEEPMFEKVFTYSDERLIEKTTYDFRKKPPTIMRFGKIINLDSHGNWLKRELYKNDTLVSIVERDIIYW